MLVKPNNVTAWATTPEKTNKSSAKDYMMGLFWNRPCSVADLNKALEKIIGEFRITETVLMLTIADLKPPLDEDWNALQDAHQKVAALTEAVAAQTTLDRSVAMLVSSQVATMRELSDRVAALTAGSITQEDLSELSGDISLAAQALAEGTAELAAAVPANTDTPTPVVVEIPAYPDPANPAPMPAEPAKPAE